MFGFRIVFLFVLSLSFSKGYFVDTGDATNVGKNGIAAPDETVFRKDYHYYDGAEGWLKFHVMPQSWHFARQTCELEGARLASPINQGLYFAMRMILQYTQRKWIHTGIHTLATENDFMSEEGVHISQMALPWAEGEPNDVNDEEKCLAMVQPGALADIKCKEAHPFICYKEKNNTKNMNECGSSGYDRNQHTGSCYKFHRTAASWSNAHSTCIAEGGHLAIINSDKESMVLKEMVQDKYSIFQVWLGFYNWAQYNDNTYYHWSTVDGKSLEEAGYADWAEGQPDNPKTELCGALLLTETLYGLNDFECEQSLGYICEID